MLWKILVWAGLLFITVFVIKNLIRIWTASNPNPRNLDKEIDEISEWLDHEAESIDEELKTKNKTKTNGQR